MNTLANNLSEIKFVTMRNPVNGHIGFVSFILSKHFFVGGMGLYSTPDGDPRIVYPQKQLSSGQVQNLFHPVTKESGQAIQDQVATAYNKIVGDER